jgi:DNA methylase
LVNLIARLIGAVTKPGDLVVDPAAGSFTVMHVATEMQRSSSAATSPVGARHAPRAASRQMYV